MIKNCDPFFIVSGYLNDLLARKSLKVHMPQLIQKEVEKEPSWQIHPGENKIIFLRQVGYQDLFYILLDTYFNTWYD